MPPRLRINRRLVLLLSLSSAVTDFGPTSSVSQYTQDAEVLQLDRLRRDHRTGPRGRRSFRLGIDVAASTPSLQTHRQDHPHTAQCQTRRTGSKSISRSTPQPGQCEPSGGVGGSAGLTPGQLTGPALDSAAIASGSGRLHGRSVERTRVPGKRHRLFLLGGAPVSRARRACVPSRYILVLTSASARLVA
jgi:hypothetical protein